MPKEYFIFEIQFFKMRISVYVPESSVIEAITPAYRAFKMANDFLVIAGHPLFFQVEYVGLRRSVNTNDNEYLVRTNRLLKDVEQTDLLILPALHGNVEAAIGANRSAIPLIRNLYKKGSSVASLCIGAFLLAETGLVNGKKCSTHWAYYEEFEKRYPMVEVADGAVITDEGNIYSSGGANTLWNLVLYLIEKYANREIAILVSKYFAIDIDRASQAEFTIFKGQKGHTDHQILDLQNYLEESYQEKITVDDLAGRVNLSRRTFERRFKNATGNSAIEYLQRVRVEAAKKRFEVSRKNVSEVMYDVGYIDTKAFREVFKKVTGLTPVAYKNRFNRLERSILKEELFG